MRLVQAATLAHHEVPEAYGSSIPSAVRDVAYSLQCGSCHAQSEARIERVHQAPCKHPNGLSITKYAKVIK